MRNFTSVACVAALLASGCASDPIGGGACSADLLPGDLVISEIFANPSGEDGGKEWFEIYNAGDAPVTMTGVTLATSRSDGTGERKHRMTAATIPAGGYFVIGTFDPNAPLAYVDYSVGDDLGDLRNTTGRIAISCGTRLIDETSYASAPDGASRSLGGAVPDAVANDDEANWCTAKSDFADGKGTPGEANEPCGGIVNPGMCADGAGMRAPVAPGPGDLVISEWMPNPSGTDDTKEWFEVLVTREVDLNGLQLGTSPPSPRTTLASPSCLRFGPGDHVLFARNDMSGMNGGLPAVDFTFGFTLVNSSGTLFVGHNGQVLDQVTYATSGDGVATQLDADKSDPGDNDVAANLCPATATYGDGDKGTPGKPNGTCGMIMPGDQCLDGATMRDVVPPQVGDLVISEWMANPNKAADLTGEWFEVLVTRDVDLNGLVLGTNTAPDGTTLTSTSCLRVTAGSYLVFARSDMSGMNGGLPGVDFTFSFDLVNSNRGVSLSRGGVMLDTVTYTTTSDGVSTQVRPDKLNPTDNDLTENHCAPGTSDTYGLGDRGTPGKVNVCM